MSNLEKIFVIHRVDRDFSSNTFIDGDTLQNDVIDSTHLPSNDDFYRTSKALEDNQIVSHIDFFLPDHKV